MSGISGKDGTATAGGSAFFCVTKWTFDEQCAVAKFNSNCTSGYKAAVAGSLDGKGTIEVKLDPATGIPFHAGQSVALVLNVTSSDFIQVPAVISGAPIECDIDNGEPVSITYAFEANGAWTGAGLLA